VPGDDVIHVMPKKLDPAAEVRCLHPLLYWQQNNHAMVLLLLNLMM